MVCIVLRTVQSRHTRPLGDVGGTGLCVGDPVGEIRRQLFVGGKAQTPARHGPCFGATVGDDGSLLHAWQRGDGVEFTAINQLAVNFIGEHPDLGVLAQNLGNRLKVSFGDDAARGVLR